MRHFRLLEEVAREHDVTLVVPASEAEARAAAEVLPDRCRIVAVAPHRRRLSGLAQRALGIARRRPSCFVPADIGAMAAAARLVERPDVTFASLYVAQGAPHSSPLVIDDQNHEARLYRQLARRETRSIRRVARRIDAIEVRSFERRWLSRAAAVTVCSEDDRASLAASSRRLPPIHVVPNGGDIRPAGSRPATTSGVLFVGGFVYEPNVDAAIHLVDDIMPAVWQQEPEAVLTLVGKEPPPSVRAMEGPRVRVTGTVDDVGPYLAAARVFAAPIRIGSGTRLKVLEAAAANLPIVASRLAVEGLGMTGEHAIIADDTDELADGIVDLLRDPERGDLLGAAARDLVMRRFSWSSSGATLREVLEGAS